MSMLRSIALALLAAVLVPAAAHAQCAFAHPKKAAKLQMDLVPAFVGCNVPGGLVPNTTSEGGIPACDPPTTYRQLSGGSTFGWVWDPSATVGTVSMKAQSKTKFVGPGNPAGDTTDIVLAVKMKGIRDGNGNLADGVNATLYLVDRRTVNERAGAGDQTWLDFTIVQALAVRNGAINAKISFTVLMNGLFQPGLQKCAVISFSADPFIGGGGSITILDPDGNPFAVPGLFLP